MLRPGVILLCTTAATTLTAATSDMPQTVASPLVRVGDKWLFDDQFEAVRTGFRQQRIDMMIERVGEDTMLLGMKLDGAPAPYEDHVVGRDWSLRMLADGNEVVTARPFMFPMKPGQSWAVDYTDTLRRGAQTSMHVQGTYKVVGWEDIAVPAGTFHALKVVFHAIDHGTYEVPQLVGGGAASNAAGSVAMTQNRRGGLQTLVQRHYSEFYYAPEVRNYVKSIEEQYGDEDIRISRQTRVLVAFKAGI